jgi:hypothetical protein
MIARLKFATQLASAGLYQTQAAAGVTLLVAGVIAEVAHKLAERPDLIAALPAWAQSTVQALQALAPIAELLLLVGGTLAAQGKPILPKAPLAAAPSLLDDETGR